MIKNTLKTLIPLSLTILAAPAIADWPVAVADKFVVHQSYNANSLDLLKNDIGHSPLPMKPPLA